MLANVIWLYYVLFCFIILSYYSPVFYHTPLLTYLIFLPYYLYIIHLNLVIRKQFGACSCACICMRVRVNSLKTAVKKKETEKGILLGPCCYYNKFLQTCSLKTIQIHDLTVLGVSNLKRVGRAAFFPAALGKNHSSLFPASRGCTHSLAYGLISPASVSSASVHTSFSDSDPPAPFPL